MNRFIRLSTSLNKLIKISNKNIEKALPIMEELEDTDNEMVDDFLECVVSNNRLFALETLQDTILSIIKDSETIKKEINAFSETVIQGNEALEEGEDEYPFLMQVWCGDIYNKDEIEGLEALVEDLKEQSKAIDEDKIVEIAVTELKTNN